MRRRRRHSFQEVPLSLAPMIDMTFLLLIFFMVTTKVSKEQFKQEIKLPLASSAIVPPDLDNRDIISVDGAGNYWLRETQVTDAELTVYLKKRFIEHPPLRLYIRADQTVRAERIKKVMRLSAEAGATDVIFGSYQKP